ncbi:TOM20 [Sanghuangporus sanghuang]
MNRPSSFSVLAVAGITVLGGIVAYAAYFDYKRRSDPSFRRKIRTQKKKVDKAVAEDKEKETAKANDALNIPRELLSAIHEKSNEESPPTNPEERHNFFVNVVGTAERLAAEGPQNYLEAAIYFYQALRVYPSPMELILIYQKTVPEPCLAIVMELYNMDVSTSSEMGGSGMNIGIDIDEASSPISKGPPSEASSQEWDKVTDPGSAVIGHIQGYYKEFPPQSMNVSLQKVDTTYGKGGQTRTHSLVTTKSFKAGDVIYKEMPIVSALDPDLQGKGTHCSHCMREISKDAAVIPTSDRLFSIYCSEKCQSQCGTQSHDLLFSDKSPLPPEIAVDLPRSTIDRPKTQDALAEFWRRKASSGILLVARLVALQIIAELAKTLPQARHMNAELPELSFSGPYTVYDHLERLRYIDVTVPEDEYSTFKNLLLAAMPFLEDVHSDERHAMFRGKIAYNAIGIYYGEGREDRNVKSESEEYTRIPIGTSKQIGTGLYFVSSYLAHSCAPSVRPCFREGTSELHLVALRDIEEGEELSMAYVDVSQRTDESPAAAYARRRAALSQGWRFLCACARCVEDKKSLGLENVEDEELVKDESKLDFDSGLRAQPVP